MSNFGDDMPPAEALGDDRPSDNEDALDDTAPVFNDPTSTNNLVDDSDDDSLLSEVDEAQFEDFNPDAVQIAPDFENLSKIKAKKRKRVDGEAAPKKKEGRRERPKKQRKRADSDEGFSGGEELEGKRRRKDKGDAVRKERKRPTVEVINEEALDPETRRRRALDRAMDAALKKSQSKRIRKGDIVSTGFIHSQHILIQLSGS